VTQLERVAATNGGKAIQLPAWLVREARAKQRDVNDDGLSSWKSRRSVDCSDANVPIGDATWSRCQTVL